MKVLVMVPHPDDEVIGCGGLISILADGGNEINLCIVTKGYGPDWSEEFLSRRPGEIEEANKILGVKKSHFLEFPTAKLDTIPQKKLNDEFARIISDLKPDLLFIPHKGDLNKDHRIIFESSLVAARPINHKIKRILSYETVSETEWGEQIAPFIPNTYVDIAKSIDKKIEAMSAYKSELRDYPHPRSIENIKNHARKRGAEICTMFAEAFILIRQIDEYDSGG